MRPPKKTRGTVNTVLGLGSVLGLHRDFQKDWHRGLFLGGRHSGQPFLKSLLKTHDR